MSPYMEYMYPSTVDGFEAQDSGWHAAAGMKRSDSQSTSSTVETSLTISTMASEYSSATDMSSAEYAYPGDGVYGDMPSLSPGIYTFGEPSDANHILSAAGSQYPDNGGSWPQQLPITHPLGTQAGNEEAARQATQAAHSLIINGQLPWDGPSSLISSAAIDEAVKMRQDCGEEEPIRPAIQDVLYRHLQPRFYDPDLYYTEIIQLLEEAAYQLQLRLQGPQVLNICFVAIAAVLTMLSGDAGTDNIGESHGWPGSHGSPSAMLSGDAGTDNIGENHGWPDPYGSPPAAARNPQEKEKFKCQYPGCNNVASRQADLERHCRIMHLPDNEKVRFYCDYKRCNRHTTPFYRQDHFRDHLREYHKEDLLRRGNKGDDEWWSSRAECVLRSGWWRCSRCLIRVSLKQDGFTCPSCTGSCEKERQEYRNALGAKYRTDNRDRSLSMSSSTLHGYPRPAPLGRKRHHSSSS